MSDDTHDHDHDADTLQHEEGGFWNPASLDVLCGRGASVNSHVGNKRFRALCFSRKAEFEAANHAAKRRIATEIVHSITKENGSRFLKRRRDKGPWFEMTMEEAIFKTCQVIRDYRRPDRLAQREAFGKKRNRATATPMDGIDIPPPPMEPIIENPYGVHDHDVLCGRGAFVNGHVGNQRLRQLAMERKDQFDAGNYTDKRCLASEIVAQIRSLIPPGRFMRRDPNNPEHWEELNDERAMHKACQVMRDIGRPDRREREERRQIKKQLREQRQLAFEAASSEQQAVEEAITAAAEAMDKALEAAATEVL